MSDLIDRQAAIEQTEICDFIRDKNYAGGAELLFADDLRKRLKDLPSAHPELNEWCHDCKEYDKDHHCCPRWNRVIKTTLAEAQQGRTEMSSANWIPCSERLPEPDQICIVTDDERLGAYEYGFHSENHDEIDGWTFLGRKIIAWMPLPEPYKGEQE